MNYHTSNTSLKWCTLTWFISYMSLLSTIDQNSSKYHFNGSNTSIPRFDLQLRKLPPTQAHTAILTLSVYKRSIILLFLRCWECPYLVQYCYPIQSSLDCCPRLYCVLFLVQCEEQHTWPLSQRASIIGNLTFSVSLPSMQL